MIARIEKYTVSPEKIKISDFENDILEDNRSTTKDGYFIYSGGIDPGWYMKGMILPVVNPEILDVFIAEDADDYSEYGFYKEDGRWYREWN